MIELLFITSLTILIGCNIHKLIEAYLTRDVMKNRIKLEITDEDLINIWFDVIRLKMVNLDIRDDAGNAISEHQKRIMFNYEFKNIIKYSRDKELKIIKGIY